jgi:superfamily II DNA or RNA helicase
MECGLGKSLIITEFARHAREDLGRDRPVLIVAPLMVVPQMIGEIRRFYGDGLPVEQVKASELPAWTQSPRDAIGITNYDALTDKVQAGRLGGLVLDESSLLKSHYGSWGQHCIRLGKGIDWKLCATGTPAPNDRIEFANHAVFLDAFPTVNAFLARFFVNRGETQNRWELKPHALGPFYRALSHWSIFVTNPGVYGWRDNVGGMPPIEVEIHDVGLTEEQESIVQAESGLLFPMPGGGIATRGKMAQLAKGRHKGKDIDTLKPGFIRRLVDSFNGDQCIIWCRYNAEQDAIAAMFPDAANVDGTTKPHVRVDLVREFQEGRRRILISKPKILGFGLNLHMARYMVFSTLQDSWEEYHQAVKRANRYGSTGKLRVHIPITELERPMIETVLRKADRIEADTREQERIFKEHGYAVA